MRPSIAILMAMSALSFRETAAQSRFVLPPHTRIRYTAPPVNMPLEAEVLVQRGDSVWVRSLRIPDTTVVELSTMTHLDISRGQDSHKGRDAGLGLLGGVAIGAVLGYSGGDDPPCTPPPGSFGFGCPVRQSAGTNAALMAGGLGIIGAGLGAVFGTFDQTDRWAPVLTPVLGEATTDRSSRTQAYRVGLRIRIF